MASIRCEEYGFDCNYVILGEMEGVIFDYWKHMNDSHGIDYPMGTIGKFVTKKIRKTSPNQSIIGDKIL